jgi:hypothetical protein
MADSVLHINYEDKDYTFDLEEIDVNQATIIHRKTGLTLFTLEEGLAKGDPGALRAIFWLMLAQNGENEDIDRINFKIVKFARAVDAASKELAEKSAPKAKRASGAAASRA